MVERHPNENGADDPLSALAPLLRVRPVLDDLCRFGGDWASSHDADPAGWAQFHLVLRGECRIDRSGEPPLALGTGDILLLPLGDAHVLSAPGGDGRPTRVTVTHRAAIRVKTSVDTPLETELVCGRLHFEAASEALVMSLLPSALLLRADEWPDRARLNVLLSAIRDELDGDALGAAAISADLGSALLVMLLRAHLARADMNAGVLRLFAQPGTRRAVLALLREPARAWTLDEIADIAAASRATLVRAFQNAVGMAPLAFLTDLRLGLARGRLSRSRDSIAEIAAYAGYQSEATFSRAFLRRYGARPGALRGHPPAAPEAERPAAH